MPPGTLHHFLGRGIEETKIFRTDTHRDEFFSRLEGLCQEGSLGVYVGSMRKLLRRQVDLSTENTSTAIYGKRGG
jgi:hypothetical protein